MSKEASEEASLALLQDILASLKSEDAAPLTEEEERKVASLVHAIQSEKLASLGLSPPPRPSVPKGLKELPINERLEAVQGVISSLQYNHRKGYLYNVTKDRPFPRIMDTAQEVLKEGMPIKCIEAVFLGVFLTAGWPEISRMPLRFKSSAGGHIHRHIVLIIHHTSSGMWGALGISRSERLMDKKLEFTSLSSLVHSYLTAYQSVGHKLLKARVGLPFEHDVTSNAPVCWQFLSVSPHNSWPISEQALEAFAGQYRILEKRMKVLGVLPSPLPTLRNAQSNEEAGSSSPRKGKKGAVAPPGHPLRPLKPAFTEDSESDEGNEDEYDEASDG
jgi:hypothetical protein